MSTYVIGDIQGCYAEFQRLLDKIRFDPSKDVLWLVGDLVNRGSASLEVLRFCKNFQGQLHCVLGNHDLHLLAIAAGVRKEKASDTLSAILNAPDRDELLEWLRHRPLLHYDQKLNTVMVHAGIYPLWTLEEAKIYAREVENLLKENNAEFFQYLYGDYNNVPEHWGKNLEGLPRIRFIVNVFTRMRVLNTDDSLNLDFNSTLEDIPSHCMPWFKELLPEYHSVRIVFGHWAALRGTTNIIPNIFALDTGCVWGGALTAMRLEDEEKFAMNSLVITSESQGA